MTDQMRAEIQSLAPSLVAWRRQLHANPEVGNEEYETQAFIAQHLADLGIRRLPSPGTSVVGIVEGSRPGKTVALRADIDALPIQEENDVPYASKKPGVMHACGHDAHTAILMGVARYLVEHRDFAGRVKLLFQPSEEKPPSGAEALVKAGVLEDVDHVLALHVMSEIPCGKAGIVAGPMLANGDRFSITIRGKGGHGAFPHLAIDSILVASQVVNNLQAITSRHVDPLEPLVVSVCTFHAGSAFNIIVPEVQMTGTARSFSKAVQAQVEREMEEIIAATCKMHGASYQFSYEYVFPVVVNHPHETEVLARAARQVLGPDCLVSQRPVMGGEDYAYYLQQRPGAFLFLGCRNEAAGIKFAHHHPRFDVDEASLPAGAELLLRAAREILEPVAP